MRRRARLSSSAHTHRLAGRRASSTSSRYASVRPVSTMSSTSRTWWPVTSSSRSFRMRTTPVVSEASERSTAMKSTLQGISATRTRSARNTTAPRSTDTMIGSSHWYSARSLAPSCATRARSVGPSSKVHTAAAPGPGLPTTRTAERSPPSAGPRSGLGLTARPGAGTGRSPPGPSRAGPAPPPRSTTAGSPPPASSRPLARRRGARRPEPQWCQALPARLDPDGQRPAAPGHGARGAAGGGGGGGGGRAAGGGGGAAGGGRGGARRPEDSRRRRQRQFVEQVLPDQGVDVGGHLIGGGLAGPRQGDRLAPPRQPHPVEGGEPVLEQRTDVGEGVRGSYVFFNDTATT